MEVAQLVATWSSCKRRQVGAILVQDRKIIATGYNGAPAGIVSCIERGECMREAANVASGTKQEYCYAVHAEQNVIAQAAKLGVPVNNATLYCTHHPCTICTRLLINSGIIRIVYTNDYPDTFSQHLLEQANIKTERFKNYE